MFVRAATARAKMERGEPMSPPEAAAFTEKPERSIRSLIEKGELKATRGTAGWSGWLIDAASVRAYRARKKLK